MNHSSRKKTQEFHDLILIHLDSAYNYAHWLTRNVHDAQDLTQEACARAFSAFHSFKNTNSKSWFLTIIRNLFLNQKEKEKRFGEVIYLDAPTDSKTTPPNLQYTDTPEDKLLRQANKKIIHQAINELSVEHREIIVLRELEEFSYNEIAAITGSAVGTVMSRLSRARQQLKSKLINTRAISEKTHEL